MREAMVPVIEHGKKLRASRPTSSNGVRNARAKMTAATTDVLSGRTSTSRRPPAIARSRLRLVSPARRAARSLAEICREQARLAYSRPRNGDRRHTCASAGRASRLTCTAPVTLARLAPARKRRPESAFARRAWRARQRYRQSWPSCRRPPMSGWRAAIVSAGTQDLSIGR